MLKLETAKNYFLALKFVQTNPFWCLLLFNDCFVLVECIFLEKGNTKYEIAMMSTVIINV